jgi:hypothetical protein
MIVWESKHVIIYYEAEILINTPLLSMKQLQISEDMYWIELAHEEPNGSPLW